MNERKLQPLVYVSRLKKYVTLTRPAEDIVIKDDMELEKLIVEASSTDRRMEMVSVKKIAQNKDKKKNIKQQNKHKQKRHKKPDDYQHYNNNNNNEKDEHFNQNMKVDEKEKKLKEKQKYKAKKITKHKYTDEKLYTYEI